METEAIHFGDQLVIYNQPSEMMKVERWLEELSDKNRLSARTRFALDLVLNEALINVINHGYDDNLEHQISININDFPDELTVEIVDDGRPFNPLQKETPELPTSLEEASIGGRGIILLKNYCTEMNYCYSEGKNRLIMTIRKESLQ